MHYQMGGIPTNYHGAGRRAEGRRPATPSCRASTRPANARASRCTAPTGSAPIRCTDLLVFGKRRAAIASSSRFLRRECRATRICPRMRRTRRSRAWRASTAQTGGETGAEVARDMRRDDAGALRRVPHSRTCWPRACEKIKESPSACTRTAIKDKSQGVQHRARRGARARQPDRNGEARRSSPPRRARNRAAPRRAAISRSATT